LHWNVHSLAADALSSLCIVAASRYEEAAGQATCGAAQPGSQAGRGGRSAPGDSAAGEWGKCISAVLPAMPFAVEALRLMSGETALSPAAKRDLATTQAQRCGMLLHSALWDTCGGGGGGGASLAGISLTDSCRVGEAALQLIALTSHQLATWPQDSEVREETALYVLGACQAYWRAIAEDSSKLGILPPATMQPAAVPHAWRLHSASCRMVHSAAPAWAGLLAAGDRQLQMHLSLVSEFFMLCGNTTLLALSGDDTPSQHLQAGTVTARCAARRAAARAAAAAAAAASACMAALLSSEWLPAMTADSQRATHMAPPSVHARCCRQVQGMSAATAEATSALLALWPPELAWELYVASSAAHELCHLAQHCPSALFATVLSHIAGRLMACLPEVRGRSLLPQTGMPAAMLGSACQRPLQACRVCWSSCRCPV
jgi:hypothetical protein